MVARPGGGGGVASEQSARGADLEGGQGGDSSHLVLKFEKPDLCRAICVKDVLHGFGRVFRGGCKGDPKDYALSHEVDHINAFLSHCWQNSSTKKTFAVMLQFNEVKATVASNIVVLLALVAQISRLLPVYCYEAGGDQNPLSLEAWYGCPDMVSEENKKAEGIWCCVLGWSTYLFVLAFGQQLQSLLCPCRRKAHVFLDKVCIQQCGDHPKIQEDCPLCRAKFKGICCLGAFLRKSRKLLILYADSYFQRLWCCYEFACFLALNNMDNIQVLPLARPMIILLLWFISLVAVAGHWLQKTTHGVKWYHFISILVVCIFVGVWLLRQWGVERSRISDHIRNFDVRKAECAVAADKALVLRRIASWSRRHRQSNAVQSTSLCGGHSKESSPGSVSVVNTSAHRSPIVAALLGAGAAEAGQAAEQAALGLVHEEASQEEALDAFNHFVQKKGVLAMKRSLGTAAIPYRNLVAVLSSIAWRVLDHIGASIAVGAYTAPDVIVEFAETVTSSFILLPIVIALTSNLACRRPDLSRGASVALCAFVTFLSVTAYALGAAIMNMLADFLRGKEKGDNPNLRFLWIYIILIVAGLILLVHLQSDRCSLVSCWGQGDEEASPYSSPSTPDIFVSQVLESEEQVEGMPAISEHGSGILPPSRKLSDEFLLEIAADKAQSNSLVLPPWTSPLTHKRISSPQEVKAGELHPPGAHKSVPIDDARAQVPPSPAVFGSLYSETDG